MRFEDLLRDVNYAIAHLRRTPFLVAIVIFTFSLGIGANVAVFSVVNAVVLRPPFPNAERTVAISSQISGKWKDGPLSVADIRRVRSQLTGVASISGIDQNFVRATLRVNGLAKNLEGAAVTSTFFQTIGSVPEIGRLLDRADAQQGVHDTVISDRVWRTYFNADPSIVGKPISLNQTSYVVVGVTRADEQVPNPFPLVLALVRPDYFVIEPDTAAGQVGTVALLAPGVSVAQLNAQLRVVSSRLGQSNPLAYGRTTFVARSLPDLLLGSLTSTLRVVLIGVFGVLLIACANVANLIAAQWSARAWEVAVRRALGASTSRIVVQLFIETALLAVCGGAVGVGLTWLFLRFIPLTALGNIPQAHDIAIDVTTLWYALLMVCFATVLAGFTPVVSLARANLQSLLKSGGYAGGTSRKQTLRTASVIAQVAIALALVIPSGLVVRGYLDLITTTLGFSADGVYESSILIPLATGDSFVHRNSSQSTANDRFLKRLEGLPGVTGAALSASPPLAGREIQTAVQVIGQASRGRLEARDNDISPDYFRALGIPVRQGRAFSASDGIGKPRVVIVNQAFVDKYLQGRDAVGTHVMVYPPGGDIAAATVVGVVGNERDRLSVTPSPALYQPVAQAPLGLCAVICSIVVRAPGLPPPAVRKELQAAFADVYRGYAAPDFFTVSDLVGKATQVQGSAAGLMSMLALVPLVLALCGIFGVVSFSVTERMREFGVRLALGAKASTIFVDVLMRSLRMVIVGSAIGAILAAVAVRELSRQIAVDSLDPVTFAAVIALFCGCAAVAGALPALRATRVNPVVVLRYE